MFKFTRRLAATAFLLGASTQAIAGSEGWSVSEASGSVFLQHDGKRVIAKRGASVQAGDSIVTGQGGRAVLVKGQDFVTVASNSRISIPQEQAGSAFTRFVQDLGNAIFRVEKRASPHFSVDTPYLAAVVKGTTFSVTVGRDDTSLQVIEGVVEVATVDGGARELVRPGSVAMIAASDRYRLSINGDQARVVDSPLRQDSTVTVPEPQSGGTNMSVPVAPAPAVPESNAAPGSLLMKDMASAVQPSANASGARFIEAAITSKPVDMGKATDGMVTGNVPTIIASGLVSPATNPTFAKPAEKSRSDTASESKAGQDDGNIEPATDPGKADDKGDQSDKDFGKDKGGKSDKDDGEDKGGKSDKDDDKDKGGKSDKDDGEDKGGKSDKDDGEDKGGKSDKDDDKDKGGKSDKDDGEDKGGKSDKDDGEDKGGKSDKDDDKDKGGKSDKDDGEDKGGKPDKDDGEDKGGKSDKDDDKDKGGKSDKDDGEDKGGKPDKDDAEDKGGKPDKDDAEDKGGKPDKDDAEDKGGKPDKDDAEDKGGKPDKDDGKDKGGKASAANGDTPVKDVDDVTIAKPGKDSNVGNDSKADKGSKQRGIQKLQFDVMNKL